MAHSGYGILGHGIRSYGLRGNGVELALVKFYQNIDVKFGVINQSIHRLKRILQINVFFLN